MVYTVAGHKLSLPHLLYCWISPRGGGGHYGPTLAGGFFILHGTLNKGGMWKFEGETDRIQYQWPANSAHFSNLSPVSYWPIPSDSYFFKKLTSGPSIHTFLFWKSRALYSFEVALDLAQRAAPVPRPITCSWAATFSINGWRKDISQL